jgi:hypothetical protein
MADIVIEPKEAPVTPPSVDPSTKAPASKGGFSDELLQIPAMQALFAGSPPALSTPLQDFGKRPEAKLLGEHKDALMKAGIGFYRSLGGDLGVLFNQLHIAGQDLQEADKAGKLLEVAPPFDQVTQQVMGSGEAHPSLSAQVPGGPKTAAPQAVPPTPTPASVQNKQATARIKNIQPGSPTSGPAPGAGRIMNNILKPVV